MWQTPCPFYIIMWASPPSPRTEFSTGKMMVAVQSMCFTTWYHPCKPYTAHKVFKGSGNFTIFVHVQRILCMLDLKILELFCTFSWVLYSYRFCMLRIKCKICINGHLFWPSFKWVIWFEIISHIWDWYIVKKNWYLNNKCVF